MTGPDHCGLRLAAGEGRGREEERVLAERVRLAAQAGRFGIWEMDCDSGRMVWDAEMFRLYGVRKADFDGSDRLWREALHLEDRDRVLEEFHAVIQREGAGYDTEFRTIRADDGRVCHIRTTARVFRAVAGGPLRIVGMSWDVTPERRRERRLADALARQEELVRQAQTGVRVKGEFLSLMSHEIRTPMNGIIGFCQLLAENPALPKECLEYARDIQASSKALLRVLDDMLDFSRLESRRLKIEERVFSPVEMLRGAHALMAPGARAKKLELEVLAEGNIPDAVVSDPARLRQILVNLIGNAVRHTEEGTVKVVMKGVEDDAGARWLDFLVRDSGPGVPAGHAEKIFEPFYQIDSGLARNHGGAGLGLAISRQLAHLLGGDVTLRTFPGAGAEFTLRVPLRPATGSRTAVREEPPHGLDRSFAEAHPLDILIVDDDPVNLRLVAALVGRLGYRPRTACDGRRAVEQCRKRHPDCVLVDIQMPGMDGIEASAWMRRLERETGAPPAFIAALTANTLDATEDQALSTGMNAYLRKPVTPEAISRLLRQAGGRSSAGAVE